MYILNAYPVGEKTGAQGVAWGHWRNVREGFLWFVPCGVRSVPPKIDGVVRVNGLVCEVELCLI